MAIYFAQNTLQNVSLQILPFIVQDRENSTNLIGGLELIFYLGLNKFGTEKFYLDGELDELTLELHAKSSLKKILTYINTQIINKEPFSWSSVAIIMDSKMQYNGKEYAYYQGFPRK